MSRRLKCRIFEWDMALWCDARATHEADLDYFGKPISYGLCATHYAYVNNL